MATHTPGPWSIEGSILDTHRNERGFIISHGVNSHGDGPEGYIGDVMKATEADARLIAAAPALLDALKAVEWSGADNSCPRCGWHQNYRHTPTCTLSLALKAARGETTGASS